MNAEHNDETNNIMLLKPTDDIPSQICADVGAIRRAFKGVVCTCEGECYAEHGYDKYDICENDDDSTDETVAITMYWDKANVGPINENATRLAEGGAIIHGDVYIVKTRRSDNNGSYYVVDACDYDFDEVVKTLQQTNFHIYQIVKFMTPDMLADVVKVINDAIRSLPDILLLATDKEVYELSPKKEDSVSSFQEIVKQALYDDVKTNFVYCDRQKDKVVHWHIGNYSGVILNIEKNEYRNYSTVKNERFDTINTIVYGVTAAMFPESFKYTNSGNYSESIADVTIPQAVTHWKANGGEGKVYYLCHERVVRDKHGGWYTQSERSVRDPMGFWHKEADDVVEGVKMLRINERRATRIAKSNHY